MLSCGTILSGKAISVAIPCDVALSGALLSGISLKAVILNGASVTSAVCVLKHLIRCSQSFVTDDQPYQWGTGIKQHIQ